MYQYTAKSQGENQTQVPANLCAQFDPHFFFPLSLLPAAEFLSSCELQSVAPLSEVSSRWQFAHQIAKEQNQTERADGLEQGATVVISVIKPKIVLWIMKKFARCATSTVSRTIIKTYVSTFSFSQFVANNARPLAFLADLSDGWLSNSRFAAAAGLRHHTALFVVCTWTVFIVKRRRQPFPLRKC